ncbi:hypothetical protein A9G42_03070 [Gilliamella sp. Nev6-6]|nr:hypothetical protein A9G42_03070 [Gilliamella apicola]
MFLVNLPDRQIIGYHVGKHKTAEFDNWLLEDCFKVFNITHSLNKKGSPDGNTVADATLKTIKTEFVKGQRFNAMTQLQCAFSAYACWYNNQR